MLLIGRATGLLREAVLAANFGLSAQGDIAALLLSLPDLLLALIVTGGMGAALVPRLASVSGRQEGALLRYCILLVLGSFTLIAGLFWAFPTGFLGLLAPGAKTAIGAVDPLVILLVAAALPIAALSGVSAAWLNARSRFLIAGAGALVFNLCVIACLLVFDGHAQLLFAVALGVLLGAGLRLLSQASFMPLGAIFSAKQASAQAQRDRFLPDFVAGSGAVLITLLPPVILRAFASNLEPGAFVALFYGQRLVELPTGVLLSALGTVALTALSASSAQNAEGQNTEDTGPGTQALALRYTRQAVLIGCAAAATCTVFAEPIVRLVLGYGEMGNAEVLAVAKLFAIGSLALPFTAAALLGTRYLYAIREPKRVLAPTLFALILCPLFAMPALVKSELSWLMYASVAVQAVLAAGIWARTNIAFLGEAGLLSVKLGIGALLTIVPSLMCGRLAGLLDLNVMDWNGALMACIAAAFGGAAGCAAALLWEKRAW